MLDLIEVEEDVDSDDDDKKKKRKPSFFARRHKNPIRDKFASRSREV